MVDVAQADALDVPNIGTRVFLRPRCRILSAKTGKVIAPEKLAAGLVAVAVLEHAIAKGRRPKTVLCADCKAVIETPRKGGVSKRCPPCQKAWSATLRRKKRIEDPKFKAREIAEQKRHRERHGARVVRNRVNGTDKLRRAARKEQGLCIYCGKTSFQKTVRCVDCRAAHLAGKRKAREAARVDRAAA